jgi:NSS family neurotransmitter:Na+ symporter
MAGPSSAGSRQTWSSNWTFILAAIGAAVGLGNIWKFPYVVGVNGGGAFVIVYLVAVFLIAIPILIGELLIGRLGHRSPPVAVENVAAESGRSRSWSIVGWMGLIAGFLIATYYSVIAGWTLAYILKAAGGFGGVAATEVAQQFELLQEDPVMMTAWHTLFITIAMFIVARGLNDGIERTVSFLMPALFVMMLVMIGYAAVAGDFGAGVEFLFNTDFSKINAETILIAIGQAFFSIGVAMGLMMIYGAYVPDSVSLTRSATIIAVADTLVAILAGLMIFPLVFSNGLDPGEGPGLIFKTLPTAFASMPGGQIFGALFFLLLAFAAVTSIIALIEPMIAFAEDRWGMARRTGCVVFGVIAWALGLGTVFSFNALSDFAPLSAFRVFDGMTVYALIDYFTANIMMPLGGILIAVFVGWMVKQEILDEHLDFGSPLLAKTWRLLIRFIAPVGILAVLVTSLNQGPAG